MSQMKALISYTNVEPLLFSHINIKKCSQFLKKTLMQTPIQILNFETIISSEKSITQSGVCKKKLLVHVSTKKRK